MHFIEFARFRVTGRVTKNRAVCWRIYRTLMYNHESPGPVHDERGAKSMFSSPDTPRQSPHLLARQQSLNACRGPVQVAGGYTQAYGIATTGSIFSNMSSNSESREFNKMRKRFPLLPIMRSWKKR